MKTLLFIMSFIAGFCGATAQQSVNACGGTATGSGGLITYSAGQVVYETYSNGKSVALGVQQPFEISTGYGTELKGFNISLIAYPNPTQGDLMLVFDLIPSGITHFEIYDIVGRFLFDKNINSRITQIPMLNLPASSYLVKIFHDNTLIKTFTIIKN